MQNKFVHEIPVLAVGGRTQIPVFTAQSSAVSVQLQDLWLRDLVLQSFVLL